MSPRTMRECLPLLFIVVLVFFVLKSHVVAQEIRPTHSMFGNGKKAAPLKPVFNSKTYGSSQKKHAVRHSTFRSKDRTTIALDIDLGSPRVTELPKGIVSGTDESFHRVLWSKLSSESLPDGVILTSLAEPGMPDIPCLTITLAIPDGAITFTPFIEAESITVLDDVRLAPKPSFENGMGDEMRYDKMTYLQRPTNYSPRLSSPVLMRTLRMISLRIPLAEYDATTKKFTAKTKFRCGISFASHEIVAHTANITDPIFGQYYKQLVANAGDVARFAVPFHSVSTQPTAQAWGGTPTFDKQVTNWIDQNAPYIKLTVTKKGLYRVTTEQINSTSGINISSWDPHHVHFFNKGVEVPLWLDTVGGQINAIEYYGEHLPGFPGEYFNWSTDSNAYWLTNSTVLQTSPIRYENKSVSIVPTDIVAEGRVSYHHERDYFRYDGANGTADDTRVIHRTQWMPGERFVWQKLKPDTNLFFDTLRLVSLPSDAANRFVKLKVFVQGISQTDGISHIGYFFVNGKSVAVLDGFSGYESRLIETEISLADFVVGANVIEIRYEKSSAQIDEWMCDYYSIDIPMELTASVDTAIAKGQWDAIVTSAETIRSIRLKNTSVASVFDLISNTKLMTSEQSGPDLLVRDASSITTTRYVAATPSSFLLPARISAWNTPSTGKWSTALDSLQGADYILITHPEFLAEAQKLEFRRKQMGLRTRLVTTDDVYNAFNFGSDEPWGIKRFLQYAFDYYAGTPVSLVTLFGDATWDPKFNLNNEYQPVSERTIHRSFVHTYGIPVSDFIFSTVERTGAISSIPEVDTLTPQFVITRVPVESKTEAEHYLDKLIDYESQQPSLWNKNWTFVIGGDSNASNPWEHLNILSFYGLYANSPEYGGIRLAPIAGNSTLIKRTEFSGSIDPTHVAEIQAAFRRGQSFVYFFGHGATFTTDVLFGDPTVYRNTGLYPVFITLSCRTGAFGEPAQITLNEGFLRTERAGTILSLGSTGFDGLWSSHQLSYVIFNIIRGDSLAVRQPSVGPHRMNIPIVFTLGKVINGLMLPAVDGGWENGMLQNSILGDAATGFILRPQPEFNVTPNNIELSDKNGIKKSVFSLADSFVVVKVNVSNFGFSAETPVHVSLIDEQPGSRQITLIDTLERLDSSATISAVFLLDTFAIGSNTLRVKVDFDDQFGETNENDNEAAIPFQVNGNTAAPLFPPEGAVGVCDITADSVRLTTLLPQSTGVPPQIEIEVDTTLNFTSVRSLGIHQTTGVFFSLAVSRSSLPSPESGVIWWRARLVPASGNPTPWSVASFDIRPAQTSGFSYSTPEQLSTTILGGLRIDDADGALFLPETDTIIYDVISRGGGNSPVSQISANGRPIATMSIPGLGVGILTADGSGLQDNTFHIFRNPLDDSAGNVIFLKSFDSLIASVPNGRKVIVIGTLNPFFPVTSFHPTIKAAMQSIGSRDGFDSVWYFDAYAFIGSKGAAPGTAKELITKGNEPLAELFDTVVTQGRSGTARTPQTAVASRYGMLRWQASSIAADSSIRFTILGVPRSGGIAQPIKNVSAFGTSSADISDIDPQAYPKLALGIDFLRSQSSTESPRLHSIGFDYDPAPEFVIEDNSLTVSPAKVEEGINVISNFVVKNITCIPATSVPVMLIRDYGGKTDTVSKPIVALQGYSQMTFTDTISTSNYQGSVSLAAVVNPGNVLNEQLGFNNLSRASYDVVRDSAKPKLDVVYDRIHINNGDYVSSKVVINVRLSDKSPLRLSDSASISGMLIQLSTNGEVLSFAGNQATPNFKTSFVRYSSGDLQGELIIEPLVPLKPGRYSFSGRAYDASGNAADTVDNDFIVSAVNGFANVMNYPNPFKDKTFMTFILKSNGEADVKCVVYTVAGRKIRTLTLDKAHQRVGLNRIEWDGRDEEGNEVANGTYLFRMTLNGSNEDGSESSDAITEKAVRSR